MTGGQPVDTQANSAFFPLQTCFSYLCKTEQTLFPLVDDSRIMFLFGHRTTVVFLELQSFHIAMQTISARTQCIHLPKYTRSRSVHSHRPQPCFHNLIFTVLPQG